MIHDAEEQEVLSSDRVRGRRQLRTAGQESSQEIGSEGGSSINNVLVTRVKHRLILIMVVIGATVASAFSACIP